MPQKSVIWVTPHTKHSLGPLPERAPVWGARKRSATIMRCKMRHGGHRCSFVHVLYRLKLSDRRGFGRSLIGS